jgi:dTDP-4-dehydrorhamnose reductase
MKTLVLGSKGQLGKALAETVPGSAEYIGLDLPDLDITSAGAIFELCREEQPVVIINAAAYTAVDKAESEIDVATAVNVEGARNVAAAARDVGARLVHISTDFVFDGTGSTPYSADAETNPLSVYGRTKRDGERAVLDASPDTATVIRTAWLYSKTGSNFVKTMLRLMQERDELSVVADQFGTPTWANSLATAVWIVASSTTLSGIFHWTDSGEASWHEFAAAIQDEALSLGLLNGRVPIRAISTEEYPTAAARPRYSVLDCSATIAALGLQPAEWRVNLRSMLKGMSK